MALGAAPPDLPLGVGGNLRGQKASIFMGVPFPGDFGEAGSQIIFSRQDNPSRAHRAAGVLQHAGLDGSAPCVAL